ncbi:MAG: BMP family ABC transporter substrate-binding protein [Clostridia bacterium]|nr:BMP family ABC transporter substrate-binding protein [Clostridia bacterium]
MSITEAIAQYRLALKEGLKYYNAHMAAHENPYPEVLEDLMNETRTSGQTRVGTIEIPADQIVGTLAAGRKTAFAGNMMPILPEGSEFAGKWIALCEAHLSDTGIHDPITCMEYMGRFYVMEGHKRVSVLKSFKSPTIMATVTRVIPMWSEDPEVQAYYEFLHFYKMSSLYRVQFNRPGRYARFTELLGFDKDHVWTDEERQTFKAFHYRFGNVCGGQILAQMPQKSLSEAMLGLLELYPYAELLKDGEDGLRKKLTALLPDLKFAAQEEKTQVSVAPEIGDKGKSLVRQILDGIAHPTLNIAFVHAADPEESAWTHGHDEGRKRLEEAFGSQIRVQTYIAAKDSEDEVMEQAVRDQAQVIFATAPTLLASARRVAAMHSGLKVLVCALSVPYTGVRTYYCRLYEAEFAAGAAAGVLSGGAPVGYIARYPILGTPAAVNAFALGVRMTAPGTRVLLKWSSLPGDPLEELRAAGVRVVNGYTAGAAKDADAWNTAMCMEDGTWKNISRDVWNWGRMYQKIVRSILDGGWEKNDGSASVNYWWGMNSGVMDVRMAEDLPVGVTDLVNILRNGLISGTIHPFLCSLRDQQGHLRSAGDRWYTPAEIMEMNWLLEEVEGRIPDLDELMPFSRETAGLLRLKAADSAPAGEEKAEGSEAPAEDALDGAERRNAAAETEMEKGKNGKMNKEDGPEAEK